MAGFNSHVLIVLLVLVLWTNSFNEVDACNQRDQLSLLIFKRGVIDLSDKLSSWSSQIDCCAWEGVQCDNLTGRVTKLDLGNNISNFSDRLQGEINLSLFDLEFLNFLDLSGNDFEAMSTPNVYDYSLIANFSNLHHLDLSSNGNLYMKNLHWLSRLSSLKHLDLGGINLENQTNWLQSISLHNSLLLELSLSDCSLSNLSPSINYVNFTSLVTLELSFNLFDSELPRWLFNLSSDISYIDLEETGIKGQVPRSLLKLRNLKFLILMYNQLNGTIPDGLGKLEHLQQLYLNDNLFYGSIPSTLGNLSTLTDLDVSNNMLRGKLPSSLGLLFNLKRLEVGGNFLFGVINETFFSKLSNLKRLDLSDSASEFDLGPDWIPPFQLRYLYLSNTIQGPNFPAWIYSQRSLETLDISSSRVSSIDGDIFWSFVANIQNLILSNNSISGDISKVTFGNCGRLHLDYNNLTGGLPNISTNNAYDVDVSHNSFSGPISTLCQAKNNIYWWSDVDVSYNLLTGPLPHCLENWRMAEYLNFGNNKLSGEISLHFSKLIVLSFINLENNDFSGAVPTMMPRMLEVMILSSNQLVGNIPLQLCKLSFLHVLDLSHNKLVGPIPQCVDKITAMTDGKPVYPRTYKYDISSKGLDLQYTYTGLFMIIDLSSNNLSGEIPPKLFRLTQLQSLNLSQNHLIGILPSTIGDMKNLESFDLSNNNLFGEIPQSMATLSFLSYLNLSCNNFVGQIPVGTQLQSFNASSYTGNPELCGAPLTKCFSIEEIPKSAKQIEGNEDNSIERGSLYLGMGVGFAVAFWGFCGSLVLNQRWRHMYYQLLDQVADWLYVTWVVKFNNFCK